MARARRGAHRLTTAGAAGGLGSQKFAVDAQPDRCVVFMTTDEVAAAEPFFLFDGLVPLAPTASQPSFYQRNATVTVELNETVARDMGQPSVLGCLLSWSLLWYRERDGSWMQLLGVFPLSAWLVRADQTVRHGPSGEANVSCPANAVWDGHESCVTLCLRRSVCTTIQRAESPSDGVPWQVEDGVTNCTRDTADGPCSVTDRPFSRWTVNFAIRIRAPDTGPVQNAAILVVGVVLLLAAFALTVFAVVRWRRRTARRTTLRHRSRRTVMHDSRWLFANDNDDDGDEDSSGSGADAASAGL